MTQVMPCEWPISYAGSDCTLFRDSGSEELQETFEAMAIELLWNWTNRVFGTCSVTVRPCKVPEGGWPSTFEGSGPYSDFPGFGQGPYVGLWQPALIQGQWFNIRCGACGRDNCGCAPSDLKSIHLPGPIVDVTEVRIEGEILAPSAYRIEQNRWLVRQDGGTWPMAQNLDVAPGQSGTWDVTYTKGIPVPMGGQVAAGRLACELAKASSGDNTCALPSRIQSISRQGVTIGAIIDQFEDLREGRTGIWPIDSWIASVTKPRAFASVRSVDVPNVPWRY